ncbi:MAG: SMP-30/gluconolactonase/LRE family protein [Betaproteobacteria bacterium]
MSLDFSSTALRLIAASVLAIHTAASAQEPKRVGGLTTPESVLVTSDGRIVVSEIGGFGVDGDGKLTLIGADGKPQPLATAGLDDPKGLAERDGTLLVADKTRVLKIDRQGRVSVLAAASAFPQPPRFLNDLAFGADGELYVSDSGDLQKGGLGAIFRVASNGTVSLVVNEARNPAIKSPNGLLADGPGRMLVVDFASGELLRLTLASGATEKLADGFGGGDGLARDAAGTLYISDWKGGKVWKLALGQTGARPELYPTAFQAAADLTLAADGQHLLVPDMKAGTLVWLPK